MNEDMQEKIVDVSEVLPQPKLEFDAESAAETMREEHGYGAQVKDWKKWSEHKVTTFPALPGPKKKEAEKTTSEVDAERKKEKLSKRNGHTMLLEAGVKRIVRVDAKVMKENRKLFPHQYKPAVNVLERGPNGEKVIHHAFGIEIRGASMVLTQAIPEEDIEWMGCKPEATHSTHVVTAAELLLFTKKGGS